MAALSAVGLVQDRGPDAGLRARYTKQEFEIPMRDGVKLFTIVYVADGHEPRRPHPDDRAAVRQRPVRRRTPTAARSGRRRPTRRTATSSSTRTCAAASAPAGEFVEMRPHAGIAGAERRRREQRHLRHHRLAPRRTFRATTGASACGASPTAASTRRRRCIDAHPALKAVSPQAPIADLFLGDDFVPQRRLHAGGELQLLHRLLRRRPGPTAKDDSPRFNYGTPDGYDFYLELGPLDAAPTRYSRRATPTGTTTSRTRPTTTFWKARAICAAPARTSRRRC